MSPKRGPGANENQHCQSARTRLNDATQVPKTMADRNRAHAQRFAEKHAAARGQEAAAKVVLAEAFELCEYGRRLPPEELRSLFPFFPER